ncbi:peptide-methionine (S)-S-oxide reductase MsrA [Pararhizobium antarcticum]|uniref:Peptide methionine sulfoxide reductase MsrA n=1 Tax=Pararhizobium antarcticum TaxID=1798805 RepID=A0A657LQT3_9HYPH|nr:peptide-methionine (S)-S-oxide reductase MsrA [Pararhizobium antarcticum]OJF91521.1 peptide-methionine (S)-S-oxide reductase [Rhizobium sp. 58]OJF94090.1 peptide-methionine (S)-S-oxide reductase [Pararhizobium antarcticum]
MFLIDMFNKKTAMPDAQTALPGRETAMPTSVTHFVNGRALKGPYPEGYKEVALGMGCFWGAERLLWQIPGVYVTAVGYAGGYTRNPTYQETTTGLTGHTEVVLVVYDPSTVAFADILKVFFEEHDPTQGMRQGNDIGTTYRSAIYVYDDAQLAEAKAARDLFQAALSNSGHTGKVTTEIGTAGAFYFAEAEHQQYLAKNPRGYCGLKGTGVTCPIGA